MTVTNFYTKNGTFFVPPYITQIIVDCRGGGGAGGSAEGTSPSNYATAAGGGAGGAFARGFFSVTPFSTASVYVAESQSFSGGYGNPSYIMYNGTYPVLAVGGQGGESVQGIDFTEVIGQGGIGTAGGSFGNLLVAGGGGASGSTFFSGISFQPVPAGGGGGGGAGFDTSGSTGFLSTGSNGGSNGAYYKASGKGGNGGLINQAGFGAPVSSSTFDGRGGGGGGGANFGIEGIYEGGAGGPGYVTIYHDAVYEEIVTAGITRTVNISQIAGCYAGSVTEVTVECWSAGGSGGGASAGVLTRGRGGGGAGGNYLRAVIPMTSLNQTLTIVAPDNTAVGTTAGAKGGSVIIRNSVGTVLIDLPGGNGGGAGSGGAEGAGGVGSLNGIITTGATSATANAGGNGSTATGGTNGDSGAGGGAAGSLGTGGNATHPFSGVGRAFNPLMNAGYLFSPWGFSFYPNLLTAPGNGGAGRLGPDGDGDGSPGFAYGGGGGGGFSQVDNTVNGGAGSGGFVRLSFKISSASDFFPFFNPT